MASAYLTALQPTAGFGKSHRVILSTTTVFHIILNNVEGCNKTFISKLEIEMRIFREKNSNMWHKQK